MKAHETFSLNFKSFVSLVWQNCQLKVVPLILGHPALLSLPTVWGSFQIRNENKAKICHTERKYANKQLAVMRNVMGFGLID